MKFSLSTKVILAVTALVVLGGGLTAYLTYISSTNALQASIGSNQLEVTKQTMDKIDRFLYERSVDVQLIVGREQLQQYLKQPSLSTPAASAQLARQLSDLKVASGSWRDMSVTDTAGKFVLTTEESDVANEMTAQPEFKKAFSSAAAGQSTNTDLFIEAGGEIPIMLFMTPVRDYQTLSQPIIGVMVGEMAWPSVLEILQGLNGPRAELLNSGGQSLGDNNPAGSKAILKQSFNSSPSLIHAQKTAFGTGILPGLDDPKNQFVNSHVKESGYLSYKGNNWMLILETPKSLAFASARHQARNLILTFFAILILSLGLFLVILNRQIVRPIINLKEAVSRLARGDFSQRATVDSHDEMGELGQGFNDMADKIQFAYRNLRASTDEAQNEKNILETLLENLPIGVLVVSAPDGKPIMINKTGKQIIGRDVAGVETINAGIKAFDIIKEDGSQYPDGELPLSETLRTGHVTSREDMIFRRPDGVLVPVRVVDAPIKDADGIIRRAVSVFEDISVERNLERSREEFFSIASHELRTPLTAIMGNSSLIEQYYGAKLPDDNAREMVSDIHESSLRLIEIVNDFLDTSRLEQKHMKYEMVNFNVLDIAHSVIKEYQVTGSRKKIHLEVQAPSQPLPLVKADKNRSKQVLINLVGNAMKFTERGSVTISFKAEAKFLKVLITDTGKGMAAESQKILFHKFEQTGSTVLTRDSVRGTGLGLYISKLIMEQMGGSIHLESSMPGVGTTFSFSLPIATDTNQPGLIMASAQPAAIPVA